MENAEQLLAVLQAENDRLKKRVEELENPSALSSSLSGKDADSLFSLLVSVSHLVPDLIWVKDLEKKYLFANKAICDKLLKAVSSDEVIGKNDLFFAQRERAIFPERNDWHTFGELCQDSDEIVLKSGKPGRFDEYGKVRGEMLYLDVIKVPYYDARGNMIGTIGIARDVTDRRLIDEDLKSYKANLERGEAISLIMKGLLAPDGRLLQANDGLSNYLGINPDTVFTRFLTEFICEEDRASLKAYFEQIKNNERTAAEVSVRICPNPETIYHTILYLSAVYSPAQEFLYFLLYAKDNTSEVQSAQVILGQQQSYFSLFQSINNGILILDAHHNIVECNSRAIELFSNSQSTLSGNHASTVFAHGSDFEKVLASEQSFEIQMKQNSNTEFTAEVYARPEEGSERTLLVITDIGERKAEERKRFEALELYKTLFSVSSNGILLIDKDGFVIDANSANLELLEYQYDELVGKHISLITGDEFTEKIKPHIERILLGAVLQHKVVSRTKTGKMISVFLTESKMILPNGEECVLSISGDLTALEKASSSLQKSEDRYKAFIYNATEGIYRLEVVPPIPTWLPPYEQNNLMYDRVFLAEANNAIAKMYGYENGEELIGKTYLEMHGTRDNPENIAANIKFITSGYEVRDAITKEFDKNGNIKYFSNNTVGTIVDNHLTTIWGTQADITAIHQANEELELSERKFRTIFNNAAQPVLLLSRTLTILDCNEALCTLFSTSANNIINNFYPDFIHPAERNLLKEIFSDKNSATDYHSPKHFDVRILSGEGLKHSRQHISFIIRPDGVTDYAIVLIDDISEHITANRDLKKLQELMRGVAEAANILLVEQHLETAISSALAQLGTAALADRLYIFENDLSDPLNPRLSQRYEWCNAGIVPQIDNPDLQNLPYFDAGFTRWFTEMKERRPISGRIIDFPQSEQDILIEQGIQSLVVVPIFIKEIFWGFVGFDDCTMQRVWLPEEIAILFTLAGALGGALLSEETNKELKKAKEVAEQSMKVQAAIFINLNHELRTPMNAILGFAQVLYDDAVDVEHKRFAGEVMTSGKRLMHTLTELMEFAQFETGHIGIPLGPVKLSKAVNAAITNHTDTAVYKGLTLRTGTPYNFTVFGEETLLQRLLETLLSNAVKFTVKGGITITANRATMDGRSFIRVDITDTGMGIKQEDINKIFIPFRQVSEGMGRQYEGSGLGLSLAKKIVLLFEGSIRVSSELNKGTTFSVFLPEASIDKLPSVEPKLADPPKKRTILFVEDNDQNILLFQRYLSLRHDVVFALDGFEALKYADTEKYDIILMDIGLPGGLDGVTVFQRIRNGNGPNKTTPIVAVTGFSTLADKQRLLGFGFNDFLGKPVSANELNRILATDYSEQ